MGHYELASFFFLLLVRHISPQEHEELSTPIIR